MEGYQQAAGRKNHGTGEYAVNILYVTPYLPYPGSHGCAAKNWDDLEVLSSRHIFHVVCFISKEDKPKLSLLGAMRNICVYPVEVESYDRLPGRSAQMAATVEDLCNNKLVDIVQCECSFMTRHLPSRVGVPAIMTEHQVYWLHFLRELKIRKNLAASARLLKNLFEEKAWLKRFKRIIFFSKHDSKQFRFLIDDTGKIEIIPLSIDTIKYAPLQDALVKYELCFLGNFSSYANIDAVKYFCHDILPIVKKKLPAVSILIVGANIPDSIRRAAGVNATCTGYVPDVREHLAACRIFINPMRLGSGMRRKILEAWAMGLPVISTSIGAEGLTVRDGENIILADTKQLFADAIHFLLTDRQRAMSIGAGGRNTVLQFHSRIKTAALLEQLYVQIKGA